MSQKDRTFDFWYAVKNTEIVRAPMKALETFGVTRVNYHLVAEMEDDPTKIRIREGRLEANRPTLITPEAYVQDELDGFSAEAQRYYEFLKQHEDNIRILQYGYSIRQESFTEQVVTGTLQEVLARVKAAATEADDPLGVVIKGVDNPWDVCLMRFFWLHVNASAPVNVRELEKQRQNVFLEATSPAVRQDVEEAFAKAQANPALVQELGAYLQKKGLFEHYQDRFFKLVRHS